ncbi:hypothetical protein QT381_10555 [Galbitalea sp. SE-J8]|uniref:hypothetical protein n=1 Tax=Galbitalea sp. SE-J8 TaxID=3054952 RepID=UPI00259C94B1|nr:hypothetical protein [Galbitalea sp. SE-J8]MDM4763450.1 hypothetical protein [Galbitalea sp. SE-J8]
MTAPTPAPRPPQTPVALFRRVLIGGGLLAVAVALVGGGIGLAVDGSRGLLGGLVGAVSAAVFLGLTAVSIIVATRLTRGDMLNPAYFAIILGGLFVKFAVFFALALALRGQDWINGTVLFWSIVAAVLGSLVVDTVAISRSRVPYTDAKLPGDPS